LPASKLRARIAPLWDSSVKLDMTAAVAHSAQKLRIPGGLRVMAGFIGELLYGQSGRQARSSAVQVRTDVPFKSYATATYRGETVRVMQACGHDSHIAMLMGIAQVLAKGRIRSNSAMTAFALDYLESQAGKSGTGQ
jgi:metal-dependent amidase/aminoacylase/carboxypeptidase family protein